MMLRFPSSAGRLWAVQCGAQGVERRAVEHSRSRVTHFLHRQSDPARRLVDAFLAPCVSRLADAGDQRERTIQSPNNLTDGDLGRFATQIIAAGLPPLTTQHAVALQVE